MAARRRPVPSGRLASLHDRPRLALPVACLLALAGLVRGPLHRATFGLPVSNDDAIPLLMARHLLRGELATTLWNQPYNGALDAYLLAPGPGPGVRPRRLSGLRGGVRGAARRARLLPRPGDRGNRRGLGRGGPRRLRHALHGLDDGHGPPSEFPHAPRDGPAPGGGPRLLATPGRAAAAGAARTARLRRCSASSAASPSGTRPWPFPPSWAWRPDSSSQARGSPCAIAPASRLSPPGTLLGASPLLVARLSGASGTSVVTAASAVTALRPPWLWGQGLSDLGHAAPGPARACRSPWSWTGPSGRPCPWPRASSWALALVLLLWLGAPVATRAPSRGLGGSPPRRLRPLAAHRTGRAAVPLRPQPPLLALAGGRSGAALRPQPSGRGGPGAGACSCPGGSAIAACGRRGAIPPTPCASGRCRPSAPRSKPWAGAAS